jgi:hypothetical protein
MTLSYGMSECKTRPRLELWSERPSPERHHVRAEKRRPSLAAAEPGASPSEAGLERIDHHVAIDELWVRPVLEGDHCQVDNVSVGTAYMWDWIKDVLRPRIHREAGR